MLFRSTERLYIDNVGQLILPSVIQGGNPPSSYLTSTTNFTFNAGGNLWVLDTLGNFISPYNVKITTTGLSFPDSSLQNTAYLGTATVDKIGGVSPDGSTITINNGVITCVGVSGNGTGTDYIEVYDRTSRINLNTTPILLLPSSTGSSVGITYDATTGVFTFPNRSEEHTSELQSH